MALQNAFGNLALDASVVATNTKLDTANTLLTSGNAKADDLNNILRSVEWRAGFDKAVTSSPWVDTAQWTLPGVSSVTLGSGQSVQQTGGNLSMVAGTTVNSETIVRSVATFSGPMTVRWFATTSQRIANNNFTVELVDVIGDNLVMTITSTTSAVVTIPNNPFTLANIGQSMYLGGMSIVGGTAIPGRYAISNVSGNDVTFTVSGGWVSSASANRVSLFGWNYQHVIYNGTTNTSVLHDSQRNGWASGDTTATTYSSNSGHFGVLNFSNSTLAFLDAPTGGFSITAPETVLRNTRTRNLPDRTTNLKVQIRMTNGSTAPASTTTFTVGFVSVDDYITQAVSIANVAPQTQNAPLPVTIAHVTGAATLPTTISGTPNVAVTNTPTVNTQPALVGSAYALVTAASTNAAVIKASPGNMHEIVISNVTTTAAFVKIYNLAAAPTVGTSTPLYTISIPASTTANWAFGPYGKRHTVGIAIAVTAAAAATDTAVTVAGIQISATYL